MKRALIIIYAIVFSLSALYAAIADGTQTASAAGGQTWYLVDDTSDVTSADYEMGRDAGTSGKNGGTNTLDIGGKNTSAIWVAAYNTTEETSNIVCRMSGNWSVTLWGDAANPGSTVIVDIGTHTTGGTFTSYGTSASQSVAAAGGPIGPFTVTTTLMNVAPDEYLAVQLSVGSKAVDWDVMDASLSPCYVTSPTGVSNDDYPGTQTISLTVTDNGGATGIDFGSLSAGTTDNEEAFQSLPTTGAVAITIETGTNVDVSVQLSGTNFTGTGGTIPMGNTSTDADVIYDDDALPRQGGADTGKLEQDLTTTPVSWYDVSAHNSVTVQCGFWMSIPSGQNSGSYTSTFTFQAVLQ